jgi:predicted ATPase/transcriptional regulator with XRE-family HTH domain
MQSKIYHSGLKLRSLRELKGLKEKELAEALGIEYDKVILWEENGIPDSDFPAILDFFEVSKTLFSAKILSDAMLRKFALTELQRFELDKELHNRLDRYKKDSLEELDISSLGLSTVPDSVYTLPNLKKIDLSDNLLSEIPKKLHTFINKGHNLSIKNNFIDPKILDQYHLDLKRRVQPPSNQTLFIEKIRLTQLRLENIGIYEDLTINFNDSLTVLIGVNGAGKTTILKALSLAILGSRDSVKSKASLLRSINTPSTLDSRITLKATLDEVEYSNQITLRYESDTSEIIVIGQPFERLFNNSATPKNLILCLGEQRNNSNSNEKQESDKAPRILDLLPLLRGDDQSCMKDFTSWWANLETSKINNPDDQNKINLCFEIFSKFMGENIQSGGLRKVKPITELWLKYDTGRSVPYYLASQGYQAVMGWIGFIIQRMIESNEMHPLPLRQPSIVIIDEIDQLLSIKWQQNILSILREFFPNTQWIISTHSPMVLTDLDKHQVIQLHERNGKIVAETNEVDLWMWQYGDIIRRYFEISTTPPKYQETLIIEQINSIKQLDKTSANVSELDKLEERLKKVKDSAAAVDKFESQLQSLKKREEQLVTLMEQLKSDKK